MLSGEIFVEEGLITSEQLHIAQEKQREMGGTEPIARVLVNMGYLPERERVRALGKMWGIPFVDLSERMPSIEALMTITPQQAKKYRAIPLIVHEKKLVVAMVNPLDVFVVDELRMITGFEIEPLISIEEDIDLALVQHYKPENDATVRLQGVINDLDDIVHHHSDSDEDSGELEDDAPIIRLATMIVAQGVAEKASDIHIEPRKEELIVRYRVDGVLVEAMRLPRKAIMPLTSRFKIMSNMDIAEKRVPQDNRISANVGGRDFDFRVSTLPTVYGEKIVMRILDKSGINVGLSKLGFLPNNLKLIEDMANRSYGIILVTGPTGSGKSTSLYSILNKLNTGESNIITIEDPVEYELDGINQCSVNNRAGMTFAAGLKAMLRQDPDIIMIGEMRDNETATIGMEAALTGHLVLSTLHTNDAPSSATRLIDMEVEPFLISSSVIGVLAQRLVRQICPNCKTAYQVNRETLMRQGLPLDEGMGSDTGGEFTLFKGIGCDKCKGTGYKGRSGVHEIMMFSDEIRDEILNRPPAHVLRQLAMKNGMRTLQQDAVQKIMLGLTTVDEVLRVLYA
ncbi:MAG: GspE/PulE family protein [Armatimonadetes bacterium]|nr:GspE/PulE family protein [Armatimonadota bacterium]